MADNREYVYRRIRRELGLTPVQAAGAIGGLGGESGRTLDPNAVNPSSGALGIGQWLGGRAQGVRKGDVRQQTSHLIRELRGPESAALARLRSARTIGDATRAWVEGFERPSAAEIASSMPARLGYARDAFRAFGKGGGGGALVRASGGGGSSITQTSSQGSLDQGQAQTLLPLLEALTGSGSAPRSTAGVAPPSFTAQATMPQGYQPAPSGGGPAPAPDIGKLADAIRTIGGEVPQATLQGQQSTTVTSSGGGGAGGRVLTGGGYPLARAGKVIGTPHSGTHTLGNWQSDNALDIATPVGTPMVAAEDAVVVKVKHHPQDGGRFAGDQITLRGKDGNGFFYAHGVVAKGLRPGERVKAGQVIGRSGSANGVAHLHIGIERGDPRKLFGR